MMTEKFREVWRRLDGSDNPHATVTLASMVEREAKLPEERPLIAAVFANRLRIGMKLDCDPTTVYAALLEAVTAARSTVPIWTARILTIPTGTRACRRDRSQILV